MQSAIRGVDELKILFEEKLRKGVEAPSPGLPLVRRAGRNVHVTVGDSGGDELLLVGQQIFGTLHRTATKEVNMDLLVELRGVSHDTV
jgi:hypothetical protein